MQSSDNITAYYRKNRYRKIVILSAFILLMVVSIFVLFLGSTQITLIDLWNAIFSSSRTNLDTSIIISIRLPRIIAAIVVGAGLSISGLIMQSITQNDMATPFTTGVSSAAGFGAALSIVLPQSVLTKSPVGLAFAFALLATICVYALTLYIRASVSTMVLLGIAFNYLFSALNSILQYFASEQQLASIVYWTFGSLSTISWQQIMIILPLLLGVMIVVYRYAYQIDLIASNNDLVTFSMGINARRIRIISGIAVALLSASIVSFTGVIGFVGMVAPHISKRLIGNQHRYTLILSAIFGSLLVLISDTLGRTLISPVSIPVGVCVSLIGVPLFILQIMRNSRGVLHGN